jgi:hypothetical protein
MRTFPESDQLQSIIQVTADCGAKAGELHDIEVAFALFDPADPRMMDME